MRELFRDKEHLVRMAGLFVGGLVVFLVLRGVLVPADFGELGHYRAGALTENSSVPPSFAGRELCESCHDEVAESRLASGHAAIACEACHGALAGHAEDPGEVMPELPHANRLCLSCHESGVAKPRWFPQVEPEEHAGGEACLECHAPHHPEV